MSKTGTFIQVPSSQEGASPRLVTETEPFPIALFDGSGNPLSSEYNATTGEYVLQIHDPDVHYDLVSRYVRQDTATTTTLAANSSAEDYQITVDSPTGFTVLDRIVINTTNEETTLPRITDITGSVFTLDRRLDYAHAIGDTVTRAIVNMATQNGTMAAPQEYFVQPPADKIFHITRMLFSASHDASGDLGKFLGIAALTNGVLIRVRRSGSYRTFTNWRSNVDIKADMYDVEFDSRSGGQGAYGTSGRGTFTNTGGVIRLDGSTNDRFEVYIQDTLTGLGLNVFQLKLQGHEEDL